MAGGIVDIGGRIRDFHVQHAALGVDAEYVVLAAIPLIGSRADDLLDPLEIRTALLQDARFFLSRHQVGECLTHFELSFGEYGLDTCALGRHVEIGECAPALTLPEDRQRLIDDELMLRDRAGAQSRYE